MLCFCCCCFVLASLNCPLFFLSVRYIRMVGTILSSFTKNSFPLFHHIISITFLKFSSLKGLEWPEYIFAVTFCCVCIHFELDDTVSSATLPPSWSSGLLCPIPPWLLFCPLLPLFPALWGPLPNLQRVKVPLSPVLNPLLHCCVPTLLLPVFMRLQACLQLSPPNLRSLLLAL